MKYHVIDLDPSLDPIKVRELTIVTTFNKLGMASQENLPACTLFDDLVALPNGQDFILKDKSGLMRGNLKYVNSGVLWKYTDVISGTTFGLVKGDKNYDIVDIDIIVNVESKANGLITFTNESIVNGLPWEQVMPNATMNRLSWEYSISGVVNGAYNSITYLPYSFFNQMGTKRKYVNISKNEMPMSTDWSGTSQIDTHTDYIVSPIDVADIGDEYLNVCMLWLTGGNPKNASYYLRINLKDILK